MPCSWPDRLEPILHSGSICIAVYTIGLATHRIGDSHDSARLIGSRILADRAHCYQPHRPLTLTHGTGLNQTASDRPCRILRNGHEDTVMVLVPLSTVVLNETNSRISAKPHRFCRGMA